MDTPTIASYYRESDPLKRKKLLEQAIAEGDAAEENAIRQEIWEVRYREPLSRGSAERADGFIGMWMTLEFDKNAAKRWGGIRHARKDVEKCLDKLRFQEIIKKSPLHEELLYRECVHMINLYAELCRSDRSYGSMLNGLISMKKENLEEKLKNDLVQVGIQLPKMIGMEEELKLLTNATKEVYYALFPDEN